MQQRVAAARHTASKVDLRLPVSDAPAVPSATSLAPALLLNHHLLNRVPGPTNTYEACGVFGSFELTSPGSQISFASASEHGDAQDTIMLGKPNAANWPCPLLTTRPPPAIDQAVCIEFDISMLMQSHES